MQKVARNGRSEPKLEGGQPRNWCLSGCKQACQANRPAPARGLHPVAVCLSLCQLWDQVAEGRLAAHPKSEWSAAGGAGWDGEGEAVTIPRRGQQIGLVFRGQAALGRSVLTGHRAVAQTCCITAYPPNVCLDRRHMLTLGPVGESINAFSRPPRPTLCLAAAMTHCCCWCCGWSAAPACGGLQPGKQPGKRPGLMLQLATCDLPGQSATSRVMERGVQRVHHRRGSWQRRQCSVSRPGAILCCWLLPMCNSSCQGAPDR